MKAKRSRVILSAISVLLVLSLLMGGTMAWFTDTEKVSGNFEAGILDIEVNPGDDGFTTTEPMEFKNLRPMLYENFYKEFVSDGGDNALTNNSQNPEDYPEENIPAYFKPVTIQNRGTLPTKVQLSMDLGAACKEGEAQFDPEDLANGTMTPSTPDQPVCENKLQDVLKIFVYKHTADGWTKIENVNLNKLYDDSKANPTGQKAKNAGTEYHTYTTAVIPAGENATYVLAGYLPETVDNLYQGKHYHGLLTLNAYQVDTDEGGNPDEGGSSSTPVVDPYTVTIHFSDPQDAEATFTPIEYELGTEQKVYDVSTGDLTAPEGYQFVEGQEAQQVTVNSEGVNPESITFLVEKINTDFAGGDGSEENPFLIMNAEQFNKIRNYSDKYFVLGADIALGEYTPIESFSGSLNGEYQGVKHSVSYTIQGGDHLGLLVTNTGILKNLTIASDSVIHTTGNNCGTIVAINGGTIEDCISYGTINGVLEANEQNKGKNIDFGGIVFQNTAGATIRNTTFQGKINPDLSDEDIILALYDDINMFFNNGGLACFNAGLIENCQVSAPESGANVRGSTYNASLVTMNTGTIRNTKTVGGTQETPIVSAPVGEEYKNGLDVCLNIGTIE